MRFNCTQKKVEFQVFLFVLDNNKYMIEIILIIRYSNKKYIMFLFLITVLIILFLYLFEQVTHLCG